MFACTNRRSKNPDLSFHAFPSDIRRQKQWVHAIRRDVGKDFAITAHTVVCSAHFVDSCFMQPVLPEKCGVDNKRKLARWLKSDAVPSIFAFRPPPTTPRPSMSDRLAMGACRAKEIAQRKEAKKRESMTAAEIELEKVKKELELSKKEAAALKETVETLDKNVTHLKSQLFRFGNVKGDSKQLEFLTGLNVEAWDNLWEFLDVRSQKDILSSKSAASEVTGRKIDGGSGPGFVLTLEDQLFLTMMRLRLGRLLKELAYSFGISEPTASRIFSMWINFLYLRLGMIPIWPDWQDVSDSMPKSFRATYPDTFIVLDATELRCQVPSSLALQSKLYSAYKSHTTVKGLVGIAPNGAFTFISQLYTGSISDRQLVIESGILSLLELVPARKRVMADRGFDIQDLLVKPNLILNIPPFKGSRTHLTQAEVLETQKIAAVRIHVERAIGRVKT